MRIKEADFQQQIIDLAHIYHWRVAHFRPAKTEHGWRTAVSGDGAGFPDCVLVRPPRLIFAELKAEKGVVSDKQQEWLDTLRGCATPLSFTELGNNEVLIQSITPEVYLWRPAQFDEIVEILR